MNGFLAWLMGLFAILPGFGATAETGFSGYVEAKYVYVAPTTAGVIDTLAAKEGVTVKQGDVLFALQSTQQQALAQAADAQVLSAQASWQNTLTGGRAEELAAGQAAVNKAKADLELAQSTLDRSQKLFASSTITQAQLDQDRAATASAEAALAQATANLAVLSLPSRDEQQKAAEANLGAARANADKAHATIRAKWRRPAHRSCRCCRRGRSRSSSMWRKRRGCNSPSGRRSG